MTANDEDQEPMATAPQGGGTGLSRTLKLALGVFLLAATVAGIGRIPGVRAYLAHRRKVAAFVTQCRASLGPLHDMQSLVAAGTNYDNYRAHLADMAVALGRSFPEGPPDDSDFGQRTWRALSGARDCYQQAAEMWYQSIFGKGYRGWSELVLNEREMMPRYWRAADLLIATTEAELEARDSGRPPAPRRGMNLTQREQLREYLHLADSIVGPGSDLSILWTRSAEARRSLRLTRRTADTFLASQPVDLAPDSRRDIELAVICRELSAGCREQAEADPAADPQLWAWAMAWYEQQQLACTAAEKALARAQAAYDAEPKSKQEELANADRPWAEMSAQIKVARRTGTPLSPEQVGDLRYLVGVVGRRYEFIMPGVTHTRDLDFIYRSDASGATAPELTEDQQVVRDLLLAGEEFSAAGGSGGGQQDQQLARLQQLIKQVRRRKLYLLESERPQRR